MANDELQSLINQTKQFLQQGKWDACITLCTEYISLQDDPHGQSVAFCERGTAYGYKGEHDRAIKNYNECLRLQPDNVNAYINRGTAYGYKGEHDRAIENYNECLRLQPDNAGTYYNRGLIYRNKGDYDRAIEDFNKVIELDTENADAYFFRGHAIGNKGDYDRAIEDFNKVIELDTENADAYFFRGLATGSKGDYDRAIEKLNESIKRKPDNASLYLMRGTTYSMVGKGDHAFQDFLSAGEKGTDLKTKHPEVYITTQIKKIFKDDKKRVKSFELFTALYVAITNIKQELFYWPEEGKEVAHYTSLHTLKKLANKEERFRLYNASYMNDPEEGRIFFDIMKNMMKKENCEIDGVESSFYQNNKESRCCQINVNLPLFSSKKADPSSNNQ